MKKNSILIAVVVLSASLFSCQKESFKQTTSSTLPTRPVPVNSSQVKIASEWMPLAFTNSTYAGVPSLQGVYAMSPAVNYNYGDHVQLVFARKMGRDSYIYYDLPATFSSSRGSANVDYFLDRTTLTINIWNDVSASMSDVITRPDKSQFERMEFRFIIIPKSTYQGLNIDWTDYSAVASALNL